MVHVQHAPLAHLAVVGTLRLEDVAHYAVGLLLIVRVVHEVPLSLKRRTQ